LYNYPFTHFHSPSDYQMPGLVLKNGLMLLHDINYVNQGMTDIGVRFWWFKDTLAPGGIVAAQIPRGKHEDSLRTAKTKSFLSTNFTNYHELKN